MPASNSGRSITGLGLLRLTVGLVVVAVCFLWLLPAFASYGDVVEQLRPATSRLGFGGSVLLAVVVLANLASPSLSQLAALPGLTPGRAVWADWSTTTVTNVIPGGSALSIGLIWAMYRSFGLARAAIARSIVVTGVGDILVKLGTPLPALLWLWTQRPVSGALAQAAVLAAALFAGAVTLLAVVVSGPATAARLGRLLNRLPVAGRGWPARLEELRVDTVSLIGSRGLALAAATVAGHANLYLLLVLCLRAVGVERTTLGWAPILAAFAFGRLVTALPITPGGLGVMEVGLTGALSAVGSAPSAALVAGVLLFRAVSFALPLPLGAVGLLAWNLRRPSVGLRPGSS
ncbi:MAG: YbhN family protein [Acidimicrobiia bacterium]|nr:YbhN family protein [Acidimicrobiia bacterium]